MEKQQLIEKCISMVNNNLRFNIQVMVEPMNEYFVGVIKKEDYYLFLFSEELLAKLSNEAVETVCYHELAHIKYNDFSQWHKFLNFLPIFLFIGSLLFLLLLPFFSLLLFVLAVFSFCYKNMIYQRDEFRADDFAASQLGRELVINSLSELAVCYGETTRAELSSHQYFFNFFFEHPSWTERIEKISNTFR